MFNPWFRLYNDIVDDEKLLLLAFEDRWHYVALLALKNRGVLDKGEPELMRRMVAVKLGVDLRTLDEIGRRLEEVGLVDRATLQPTGWDTRQFKSDTSRERVAAYRERQKASQKQPPAKVKRSSNVTVTAQETETETETERSRDKKHTGTGLDLSPLPPITVAVWQDYLKHRKAIKAPLTTQTAINRLGSELHRIAAAGITPDEALSEAIESGWRTVKLDWLLNRKQKESPHAEGKRNGSSRAKQFADTVRRYADDAEEVDRGAVPQTPVDLRPPLDGQFSRH